MVSNIAKMFDLAILWVLALSIIIQCPLSVSAEGYDVSEWARKEIIMPLEEFGIDNFKNAVNRETFCEIVCKVLDEQGIVLNCYEPLQNPFSDTNNMSVIRLYNVHDNVLTPSGQKIIYGKSDTLFSPDEYITREEAACIMFRIYWFLNPDIKLNKRPAVGVFLDDKDISDWAYTAVYVMASNGVEVMVGDGDNCNYYPKNNISAEQSIVAVQRLSQLEKE